MSPIIALLAAASPEVIATAAPAPALAIAQESAPAAAQAVTPATNQGVTSYPASFFAEAQPNSAMDMIARIPGFAFDPGDSVRGYGGAAGNVLIDGQRNASKSEGLEDALRRLQAKQVERIDIIRGGAPGIDMQGKTVIANVVLRKDGGGSWLFAVANAIHQDGRTSPAMRFEGTAPVGPGTFTWSNLFYKSIDDGAGEGVQRSVIVPLAPDPVKFAGAAGAGIGAVDDVVGAAVVDVVPELTLANDWVNWANERGKLPSSMSLS